MKASVANADPATATLTSESAVEGNVLKTLYEKLKTVEGFVVEAGLTVDGSGRIQSVHKLVFRV